MDDEPLIDIPAVANYLGVPTSTVYRLVNDKENPLPGLRAGKHWRFRISDIKAWLVRSGNAVPASRPVPSRRLDNRGARGLGGSLFTADQLAHMEAIGITTAADFTAFAGDAKKRAALAALLSMSPDMVSLIAGSLNS